MRTIADLRFITEDIGGTQMVTVKLGDHEVGEYLPGTRHDDHAIELIERAFAEVLADLVKPRMTELGIREYKDEF